MSASPPPSSTPSPPSTTTPPPPSSATTPPPPSETTTPPPPSSATTPPPSSTTPPPPPSSTTSPPPPSSTTPPPPSSTTIPPPPSSTTPPPPSSTTTPPPPMSTTPPPESPSVPPPSTPPPNSPPPTTPPPASPPPITPPPTSPPPVSPPPATPPPSSPPPVSPPPATPPPSSPPPVSPPPVTPPPSSPPPATPPPSSPPPATPPPTSPPPTSPPPTSPPPSAPPPLGISPPPPEVSPPPHDDSPPPPNPPPSPPSPVFQTPPPPPPPESSTPVTVKSNSNKGLIVGVTAGAAAGVIALFAICLIFFLYKKKSRRRDASRENGDSYYRTQINAPFMQSRSEPPSPSYQINNVRRSGPGSGSGGSNPGPILLPLAPSPVRPTVLGGPYKYEDLSVATNGFAESNVLGQGGFGLVYRGTLNEKEVAIKKLRSGGGQGEREFRAEVEIISRVHHRNLVSLVGYCMHEEQRLLVYEYVPNKTLEFHLHGSGRPTLDWARRWKIALGAAKGFAYLHEGCDPKIIHRDIKAANILLDYNFEPKVADFGLAKLVPVDMSHVSTRVMGTFGYVAPEYAQSGKLTDKSDVYSYGVMLLELITGKKPLMSSEPYTDLTLVGWATPLLSRAKSEEVYDELVDPRLETNYDQYDMTRLIDCAAAATRNLARKRPQMSQIVRYLEGEISLEDLNAGLNPGNSRAGGGVSSDQVNMLRRMAFGGLISEDLESEQSEPTSELNPTPSSGADTAEIEMRQINNQL